MNIYEIAKICDVSVTTVSKVINGKEGVGEATRKKINQVIETNDFKPKISSSSLDVIGIVYRTSGPKPLSSPYLIKVLEGITNSLYELGKFVTLIPYEFLPKEKVNLQIFCQKRRIAGFIFLNLRDSNYTVSVASEFIPTVTVGSKFEGNNIVSVMSKNKEGGFDAVDFLISLGHTKIAIFVPDIEIPDHRARLEGYKLALQEHNIELKNEYIVDYLELSHNDLIMTIENLFENKETSPTAFFVCDDLEVLKISTILSSLNLSIPQDISVVGFDDYEYASHLNPPLTTVRQPLYELGEAAGNTINKMIEKRESNIEDILLETKLIVRKSAISI